MALWEPELSLRIAHEKRPSTAALEVAVTEIAAGQTLTFGRTQVEAVAVDHKPVRHAFGFVFRSGGLILALSGDTRRCEALIAARSEEHTSELQSLMRISYAVFCLKKKNYRHNRQSKALTTDETNQRID